MKAVLMTAAGSPEVLQLQEVPEPTLQQPTDLLIRLKAAGINPIDIKLRQRGTFYPDQMPAILGCDGAGVVEAVGSGVQHFQVGDPVYFCNGGLGTQAGNYAEFVVVDERFVARKPNALSFAEAAAAPLVLITAWESLFDRCNLQPGQRVLIQAGAGGVGHVAIQLAALKQAHVATTVGSEEKARLVRQLGAELAILYKQTDVVQAVMDWTQGEGVDIAFDTVGGKTFFQSLETVKVYGEAVSILEFDNTHANWKSARMRNLRVSQELMLTPMLKGLVAAQQHQAQILKECAQLFDAGKLKIHLQQVFPLAEAAKAHQLLETGSMTGKLVLHIAD